MSSISIAASRSARSKFILFFWLHPEWWSIVLCGSAWSLLLMQYWQHFKDGTHHRMGLAEDLPIWMLMVAAMMLPLVMYPIRATATGSLWDRRHRAIAGFLTAFFAPWLALGLAAALLVEASGSHTDLAAAVGFGIAAWWQRTTTHWRAIGTCHRLQPLAPLGWRADRDCLRFGWSIGTACVCSCWPLMLACAFTGHSLVALAGGMSAGISERWYYRPRTRRVLAVTLMLAFYYAGLSLTRPHLALASPQRSGVTITPQIVASTAAPFSLGRGETRVELAMHPPTDPLLMHAAPRRRVFLNIEKIISEEGSGPYDVYLNLPSNARPAQNPGLYAGELPLFGLAEASRPYGDKKAQGLYQQLEITDLYDRLSALPGWESKRLSVTFVPWRAGGAKVHVSRVTVTMAYR